MRRPFHEGDRLVLTPATLGKRGEAEAEHEGWRVRVAGGLPGEAARVRITHVSKGGPVARAVFEAPAADPHPSRRVAPCPIHDTCGGCGLQHVGEDAALAYKIEQARRLLPVDDDPIVSPRAFGYRAKTFLLPQRRHGRLMLGARPPRGPKLVDTTGCGVLRPELEALAQRLRDVVAPKPDLDVHSFLLRCNRAGQTQLTAVHRGPITRELEDVVRLSGADASFRQAHPDGGNRVCSDQEEVPIRGRAPIAERFDGIEAEVPPTAFCQGNPDVAERLYRAAADALEGDRLAELYCGGGIAGLLALRANPAATLHGVDRAPRAVAAARRNAERNGLAGRCRFDARAAEDVAGDWESVLVNPPRAGCDARVLDAIAKSGARRLVYLSCNPRTLARDVAALGWHVESVRAADMFPQTPHLELLAVIRPSPSRG